MKRANLAVAVSLVLAGTSRADTFHLAYDKAATYGEPTTGIVVHLHGCRQLNFPSSWMDGWRNLLVENGYMVVAPDSYDDPRSEHMCPDNEFRTLESIVAVFEFRVKQTSYAIEQIRESHPDKKLFVWGFSEGAFIANRLTEEVDGIVTTGGVCQDLGVDVAPEVPLLTIIGADDDAIDRYLRRKKGKYDSMEELCQQTMTSENREWLIVEGMGHEAPLVFSEVMAAVTKFFGIQN